MKRNSMTQLREEKPKLMPFITKSPPILSQMICAAFSVRRGPGCFGANNIITLCINDGSRVMRRDLRHRQIAKESETKDGTICTLMISSQWYFFLIQI